MSMSQVLTPESPLVFSAFPSPDLRPSEASSSLLQPSASSSPLLFDRGLNAFSPHRSLTHSSQQPSPRFLSDPSPSTILSLLEEAESSLSKKATTLRSALILRCAIRWAVEHADTELIAWLVALQGRWVGTAWSVEAQADRNQAETLDEEVKVMSNDDGWSLLGMAVQSTCGRQEMEEGVRAIVNRWGLEIGPRAGRDKSELVSCQYLPALIVTQRAGPLFTWLPLSPHLPLSLFSLPVARHHMP